MEQWERWTPIKGISGKLFNDSFIDSDEGIILKFSDETYNNKLIVKFDDGVLAYRNTDEGSLLKKLKYLHQQYGQEFYSEWTLFKVRNSEFLSWFLNESSGIYELYEVEHYVFLTSNDVIEILSAYAPSVIIE